MLEDSVSKIQGLQARALDLPRGTPGRRGAGRGVGLSLGAGAGVES